MAMDMAKRDSRPLSTLPYEYGIPGNVSKYVAP